MAERNLNDQNSARRTMPVEGEYASDEGMGQTILHRDEASEARDPVRSPDSMGEWVELPPEQAGTVAGNTTGADAILVPDPNADDPQDELEDLGPEGTIVQQLGGEARF